MAPLNCLLANACAADGHNEKKLNPGPTNEKKSQGSTF